MRNRPSQFVAQTINQVESGFRRSGKGGEGTYPVPYNRGVAGLQRFADQPGKDFPHRGVSLIRKLFCHQQKVFVNVQSCSHKFIVASRILKPDA